MDNRRSHSPGQGFVKINHTPPAPHIHEEKPGGKKYLLMTFECGNSSENFEKRLILKSEDIETPRCCACLRARASCSGVK